MLTFDHEHVPGEHLHELVAKGIKVRPGPDALLHAQDKLVMRRKLAELGAAGAAVRAGRAGRGRGRVRGEHGWPCVLKAARGGYDGRGVWMLNGADSATELVPRLLESGTPLLVEERVAMRRELAALVARSPFGQGGVWPVVETVQSNGICVEVLAPAPDMTEAAAEAAQELALRIAAELDVVGVLAVELFDTEAGLVVNELAMRPHNSGHWTIEGARTSQFEQHLRAVLDYPLGATDADGARGGDGERARRAARAGDGPGRAAAPPVRALPRRARALLRQAGAARPQDRARDHARRVDGRRAGPGQARRALAVRTANGWTATTSTGVTDVAPLVGVIMGSDSDWPVMRPRPRRSTEFEVPYEVSVVSAHRTPQRMLDYARDAADRGLRVIIAGAGGAAHLPGMVASATTLPVIGVPVPLKYLDGLDSLLSIVQMPAGIPVATVSVGGARNAGLLAVRMLAVGDEKLRDRLAQVRRRSGAARA